MISWPGPAMTDSRSLGSEDVARNNAHDAHHHLWDIDRTLRAAS
ncbi:MAG TPA: hypothetical protein VHS30_26480 [Streptosporangiaceae bacterium]|jgi:hypothetical protein|nr:hypothetical protein [Streptosporangiaceae bacterium]